MSDQVVRTREEIEREVQRELDRMKAQAKAENEDWLREAERRAVGRYQLASQPALLTPEGRMLHFPAAIRFDTVTGMLELIPVPKPEEPKIKPARILDLGTGGMPS